MVNTIQRQIGGDRSEGRSGNARIWLEGKDIGELGWTKGTRFYCDFSDGEITYTRIEEGEECPAGKRERKVAGDPDRPIIDTRTNKIRNSVGESTEKVKVEVGASRIRIIAASLILAASLFLQTFPAHAQKVLVACEYSGAVRDAFAEQGHYAVSCDLLPTERPGNHYQGDVLDIIDGGYDLMVGHPPCDHLSLSGARWCTDHWVTGTGGPETAPRRMGWVKGKLKPQWWHDGSEKRRLRDQAIEFFRTLWECSIPRICLENPMSVASSHVTKRTQEIQPWQFGHGERKATWLWLKNLPMLTPTDIVAGREARVHMMAPGPNRWKERSRTFVGIARAMAAQFGATLNQKAA